MVMMSPLSAVGEPPLAACFNRPDSTDQPLAGKPAFLKPRHPLVVVPSNNGFQPASRSADVRVACSAELTVVMAVRRTEAVPEGNDLCRHGQAGERERDGDMRGA